MTLFGYHPIQYFNRWLTEPVRADEGDSVRLVLDALNRHPLAQDETAQNYIMPPSRYRERPDRFRIFGENQDTWYCFVYDGEETLPNPPVYFETCLSLSRDHGFADSDIIGGDHVRVCRGFTDFLWHMLGQQLCVRLESSGHYVPEVQGAAFKHPVALDNSFTNPLDRGFPSGFTPHISHDVVCVPDWGAAFLDSESARRFFERFRPTVSQKWAEPSAPPNAAAPHR
jgi:hypothetical protein